MSHDLEMLKNGEASMAYTNEVPWHGLGFRVDGATIKSAKEMMKAAKIDWLVEKTPVFDEAGNQINGAFQVRRVKDKQHYSIVGADYIPVQNADAFEFFTEYLEAGDATMETAGSLRNGEYVWGLARLDKSFKLKHNDVVNGYVLVGIPHKKGKSVVIRTTSIRVVCNNTLTMALAEHRHSHRTAFTDQTIRDAKEKLGIAREQMDQFEETARTLQKKALSREDVLSVLAPIFSPNSDLAELTKKYQGGELGERTKLGQLMGALEHAPGAQPDNGWGVLNAVTYYADHMASRSSDKRLTNAWFGKTASQKTQVMEALLAA